MRNGMATLHPSKKRKKGRVSNAVIFLLVFILFVVVFGGLCLWAVSRINSERKPVSSSNAKDSLSSALSFSDEDARYLLLVTTDAGEARGFVVIYTDPAASRIRTMAVPRDTNMDVGTEQMKLYELYRQRGIKETQKLLGETLHVAFSNYLVMTYEQVGKWVQYLDGGLAFDISENLDYRSEDGTYSIHLNAGRRSLTPGQVVDILRYPKWNAGRRQEADIQAQLLTAMINQYWLPDRNWQKDFEQLIAVSQSDIRISHFVQARSAIEFLATKNVEGHLCSSVSLGGTYVGSGDQMRFEIEDTAMSSLQAVFRGNFTHDFA